MLATQFSFANWTGNKGDMSLRQKAKANTFYELEKIFKVLEPKSIVPFANFSYFSHEENSYLNEHAITFEELFNRFDNQNFCVLGKNDTWHKERKNNNEDACKYWENKKQIALSLAKIKTRHVSYESLCEEHNNMTSKLAKNNDLQGLKKQLLAISSYRPSFIFLEDLNIAVRFDIFNEIKIENRLIEKCDIIMSSESLYNVMKNKWGFGTLMINGRFQANYKTFHNFVLQTRLYYMNNIGKQYPEHISLDEITSSGSLVKRLVEEECPL